jgi:hypothetical protein
VNPKAHPSSTLVEPFFMNYSSVRDLISLSWGETSRADLMEV